MTGKIAKRKEVAEWYGVTTKTVENWEHAGLKVHEVGGPGTATLYNALDVDEFRFQRRVAKDIVTHDGETYDKSAEEARLKHHQANNEALKEAETTGQMLNAGFVVDMCSALVSNARARLLVIHNGIRNRHPEIDQAVVDEIESSVIEALNELGTDGIPSSLRISMERYNYDMDSAT